MALKTPDQFMETLKKRKSMNIWFNGEKLTDPTEAPALQPSVHTIRKVYEMALHPKLQPLLTTKSESTGERVHRYVAPLLSREDAITKARVALISAEIIGCCSFRCTGSEAIGGLYPFTYDLDEELGTEYHQRLKKWIGQVQANDMCVTATLTDPKGDRRKKPHEQDNELSYAKIVERRKDGIVISGAKVNQTGILFAEEFVVVPTSAMGEEDKDYAFSCAVPADADGLTYILGRTPQDLRLGTDADSMIDAGKKYADHQAMVIFDKVFVPWEKVFFCGEWKFAARLLEYFTAVHRLTAGACKSGGLSVLLGATGAAASYIGVEKASHVRAKLTEVGINASVLYSLSLTSAYEGFAHPSGAWVPNSLFAHCAKYLATQIPFDACRISREIISGWGDTAPSAKDLHHEEIGPMVEKFFSPGARADRGAEDRLRIIRLIENLTRGSNWTAMALHGGGNMEAAKLMAMRHMDWGKLVEIAEVACGVKDSDEKVLEMIAERAGKIDVGEKAFGLKK
jgi:4-hydroxybutyryl-CoA dehydratase/vinylacetyl-CoA-Delta-isomerase